LQSI